MVKLREIYIFAKNDIKKSISNPKIWMVIICCLIIIFYFYSAVNTYLKLNNTTIGIFELFPIVCNNSVVTYYCLAAFIIMISDAPFYKDNTTYYLVHSTRTRWVLGQALYIFIVALIFHLLIFMITLLLNFGHLNISNSWSDLFSSLTSASSNDVDGVDFSVVTNIITDNLPLKATIISYVSMVLMATFIGFICMTFNMISKSILGYFFASFFIVINIWIKDLFNSSMHTIEIAKKLALFSPLDCAGNISKKYISFEYTIIFFLVTIICLIIVDVFFSKKYDFTLALDE